MISVVSTAVSLTTVVSLGLLSECFSGERKDRRDATDAVDLATQFRDVVGVTGAEALTGDGERIRRPNSLKREVFDADLRR